MSNEPRLDPAMRARVLAAVDTPSPTRASTIRRAVVIASVSAILALGVFLAVGGLREWGAPRPPSLIAGTALGLAGLAGIATYFAFHRGGRVLGRPAHQLWSVILVMPLAAFCWKVLWSSLYAGGLDDWPTRFGNKCLSLVCVMGGLMLIGGLLIARGERSRPGLTGASIGLAAGTIATVLADLWCPVGHPFHVFYGHIMPIVLLSALGALIMTADRGRGRLPARDPGPHRS